MCYGKKSIKYDPHYKFCRCNEIMMQHHTYLLTSPLRYQSAATCPAPMLSSLPLMIHRVIATRQATDSSNARFIGFLPLLNKEQSKPRYHRFSSSPRRVPKVKCIRHMSSFEKPRHQPMSRSCTACSHSRESNFRVHAIWNQRLSERWVRRFFPWESLKLSLAKVWMFHSSRKFSPKESRKSDWGKTTVRRKSGVIRFRTASVSTCCMSRSLTTENILLSLSRQNEKSRVFSL